MRLFENPLNIISEVNQMEKDEYFPREDRVAVSEFFHGQPPYSDEEAEALGLQINVNNLFGFTQIGGAKDQLLSLYTTPPRLWEIELNNAPPSLKDAWENKATQHWNRIMRESGRLKAAYEFVAGDSTLHGEGLFWFPNRTDWCPRHCSLARRLIPKGATLDTRELTHFAVTAEMPFRDLVRYSNSGGKGWNRGNLKSIVSRIFQKPGAEINGDARSAVDASNVELISYERQANAGFDRVWRYSLPVIYFFQVNFDLSTQPFDMTVIARDNTTDFKSGSKDFAKQAVLFESESHFPTVTQALFPLHMSCMIGGEPLWHRVLGQGHLNYSLSWHLEVLFNRALQAVHEQNTTFFQASDSATRESMEQILLKHNGILPEGISLVQNRVGGDFNGLIQLVQLIRQQAAANTNSIAPNNGNENMLEVQATFQQNAVGTNASNRVSHWFDYMNRLGKEVLRRFSNPLIMAQDPGYSEIMAFQAAMMREQIPLSYLQPANVRVTTARVVGDGVKQKAVAAAGAMMQNITQYGPEAQQDIRRAFAAVAYDDYAKAEKLVPYTETPDGDQILSAETENNVFAVQQKPMRVRDKDVDSIHLASHFDFLVRLLTKGIREQSQHFTPDQSQAFQACGAHCILHIRKVEGVNKDMAAKFMDELNKLAAIAQKLQNNLQQAQQQQQAQAQEQPKPMTEAEKATVALAAAKNSLDHQKLDFAKMKFMESQSLREHESASRNLLAMTKDNRDATMTRQEMAIRDAEAAAGVGAGANPGAQ